MTECEILECERNSVVKLGLRAVSVGFTRGIYYLTAVAHVGRHVFAQPDITTRPRSVDEWFFDIIADVLDERKELKAQKLPKKEYQLKKKELQVKFEELGDEYEDLIAKCTEIDELSTTINSVVPVDTILIEEEPTSFREMLGNALTRGSTRRKQTNVRMPLVYDTYTRDSMEKVVDSPQPKNLMECTQKEQLGACRACVDDWYEDKFEKDFYNLNQRKPLLIGSFKEKLDNQIIIE
mgnify:CR=1 FL=1